MTPNEPTRPIPRVLHALRNAWLIAGISLGLLLALEGGYRLQIAVKQAARSRPPTPWDSPHHPYHGQAWYPEFVAALNRRTYALDPYRGFWLKPQTSRYLNIDSSGRRLTAQPPVPPGAPRALLFGGSAAWGLTVRDSFTIASQLAAALHRRGVTGVEIVSDAQPGFNATQEAATLQMELAAGVRPAAVVFLNGYNDAAAGIISGRAGITYSQGDAQILLDRGRRGFWGQVAGLGQSSLLLQRIRQLLAEAPARPHFAADAICPAVAAWYGSIERGVLATARDRGVPALIFLQPHHATSHKRLTHWEASLVRDPRLVACADSIVSVMVPYSGSEFFDLRALFDDDTETVFVDFHSHVTEAANGRIADAIADHLAPILSRRSVTGPAARSGGSPDVSVTLR